MAGLCWDGCPEALPKGTVLNGSFEIRSVLGRGGFGITYEAYDLKLNRLVAIKEYFPSALATRIPTGALAVSAGEREDFFRYGLESFSKEARTLASFVGRSGIIWVFQFFEENQTAYYVMEYLEGENLNKYLKSRGERIPWHEALSLLSPVMDALGEVHIHGIVHRDVKPENIMLTRQGAKLIDFGAARQNLENCSMSVVLTHGFAPAEQYSKHGNQGPWTDVYALGATLYYAVTGIVPQDSIGRLTDDRIAPPSRLGADIPASEEAVLLRALSVHYENRFQTMDDFRVALRNAESFGSIPSPMHDGRHKEETVFIPDDGWGNAPLASPGMAGKQTSLTLDTWMPETKRLEACSEKNMKSSFKGHVRRNVTGKVSLVGVRQPSKAYKVNASKSDTPNVQGMSNNTESTSTLGVINGTENNSWDNLYKDKKGKIGTWTKLGGKKLIIAGSVAFCLCIFLAFAILNTGGASDDDSIGNGNEILEETDSKNEGEAVNPAGSEEDAAKENAVMTGYKEVEAKHADPESGTPADSSVPIKETNSSGISVGDIYILGTYEQDNDVTNGKEAIEWRVLSRKGDSALLVSSYGLDAKPYNTEHTDVTWEICTLRTWLNGEFYETSFTDIEKTRIVITDVKAEKATYFDTDPGNDTRDKIFLLGYNEAEILFVSNEDRKCSPTAYAINNGAFEYGGFADWWLRSPGDNLDFAETVNTSGSFDSKIVNFGDFTSINPCVRPALWLKLES